MEYHQTTQDLEIIRNIFDDYLELNKIDYKKWFIAYNAIYRIIFNNKQRQLLHTFFVEYNIEINDHLNEDKIKCLNGIICYYNKYSQPEYKINFTKL